MIGLIVLNSLMSCALAMGLFRSYTHNKRMQKQFDQYLENSTAMMLEHESLVKADLKFQHQIQELDRQLLSISTQLQQFESTRENDGSYNHALKILSMGGSRQEIIDSCHLSSAQADLIMNLHAYSSAINPVK